LVLFDLHLDNSAARATTAHALAARATTLAASAAVAAMGLDGEDLGSDRENWSSSESILRVGGGEVGWGGVLMGVCKEVFCLKRRVRWRRQGVSRAGTVMHHHAHYAEAAPTAAYERHRCDVSMTSSSSNTITIITNITPPPPPSRASSSPPTPLLTTTIIMQGTPRVDEDHCDGRCGR
jgi:hypothetical protein